MILKIQRDESLHSYMQRILYLNLEHSDISKLKKLLTHTVDILTVKTIASILKWPGCYGFNRILHDHTSYPISGIFKDPYDISYSQRKYISKGKTPSINKTMYAYCPECIRGDLIRFGYSYWRRSHQSGVTVCGKHNVVLVTRCPFCDATFSFSGHSLDVMWRGCSGNQLSETDAVENRSTAALKEAEFLNALFTFGFHIPIETAMYVLYERFLFLRSTKVEFTAESIEDFEWVRCFIEKIDKDRSEIGRSLFYEGRRVIKAAIAAYDSFDDFAQDIKLRDNEPCSIEDFWSTYASEGHDSVHYIEEIYANGVGVWSCPYPSLKSLNPISRDGSRARQPLIYPCCNFTHPSEANDQLAPKKVRSPMPKISLLIAPNYTI